MDINDRIMQFLEYKGVSKYAFYKKTGFSNGILDKKSNIGSDKCERIIYEYPELNAYWLLTGKGDMLLSNKVEVTPLSRSLDRKIELQQIPLYDLEAVAGFSMINNEHSIPIDYISIPNMPLCNGAIKVRGDSMLPKLQPGDIIIFKMIHNTQYILWNEMYIIAFEIDGDYYTVIKLIKKSEKPNHIQLFSINQEYEPIDIPIDSIRQLASVQASIHYHSM